jgi:hypothetical protein
VNSQINKSLTEVKPWFFNRELNKGGNRTLIRINKKRERKETMGFCFWKMVE